jgi:hypothetical protein
LIQFRGEFWRIYMKTLLIVSAIAFASTVANAGGVADPIQEATPVQVVSTPALGSLGSGRAVLIGIGAIALVAVVASSGDSAGGTSSN